MATLDSSGSAAPRPPIPFGQGIRPYFKLPDHIKPPPGFPFIVLPAEPVQATPNVQRRRLADNVVALWSEDRTKVENIRWRGRYPRVVRRMYPWDRLHEGDYCMLWVKRDDGSFGVNHGIVVQLIERDRKEWNNWHVKAINRPVHTYWTDDPDNPQGHKESWTCVIAPSMLRRCPAPGGRP